MNKRTILVEDVDVYGDGNYTDVRAAARWAICESCDGEGEVSQGWSWTAEEFAAEDDQFKEDYLMGRFDEPCKACRQTGKVLVLDERVAAPAVIKAVEEQREADYNYAAERAAEIRAGC